MSYTTAGLDFDIDKENRSVTVKDDSQEPNKIEIAFRLFEEMYEKFLKEVHYLEDVLVVLSDKIDDNELPEEVLDDEEYINHILDEYTELRKEHDSGGEADEVWHWEECMKEAIKNNPYEHDIEMA